MLLSRVQNIGYVALLGLLMAVLILGWNLGRLSGDGSAKIGVGSRVKLNQRLPEERSFIRYTANDSRLALPSSHGTAELCRRFGITQAALGNANGQRDSPMIQLDAARQIRIPL